MRNCMAGGRECLSNQQLTENCFRIKSLSRSLSLTHTHSLALSLFLSLSLSLSLTHTHTLASSLILSLYRASLVLQGGSGT